MEKYAFSESSIRYQVIASCTDDTSYFSWGSNKAYFESFIQSYFKIDKLQGTILQYQDRIREKIKVSEDPAFNEEVKLLNQIPSEFMKGFYGLKKEFGDQY